MRRKALASSACASPDNKRFCPETFLDVVAEKLAYNAVLFINYELLQDFFFQFPRELDSNLYYGKTLQQTRDFASQNPHIGQQLKLIERRQRLELVMTRLNELVRQQAAVEQHGRKRSDELFTDAFEVKDVGGAYEVDCKMVTLSNDGEIDIGGNPSAEEAEEQLDDSSETVNDVVHAGRLQETQFDKKSYMIYIKGYMKAIKAKLQETKPESVAEFEKNAATLVKKIIGDIKNYEFYTGESMDPDGMVALLNYREDGVTPYFTFFKDGLIEEKL
ncbi:hypothetical protein IWW43_002726 [Coemansia sp. RSA 1935]|nr:hypothetical protein IWW43_002726 [Coemansia sp. RSA 1935]